MSFPNKPIIAPTQPNPNAQPYLPFSIANRHRWPHPRNQLRKALAEKQSAVEAHGNAVRALKAAKASKPEIDAAIEALNSLKLEKSSIEKQLQAAVSGSDGDGALSREAFRQAAVNTLERRLFYIPSFKIYRGVAGLYDYGPPGCAVKSNVLAFWRQHFVLEENMLEVDCPCVTPEVVLKASGHVDKFTDLMVKDEKTGTCYRADHLLKDFCNEKLQKDLTISAEKAAELKHVLATLDDLSAEALGAKIKEYGITAPDTKNPLSDPYPFNLMFQTSIGPSGLSPGYMRPETAQGIFVNFKDLYYYNGNKLPFAAAQIGQAFRNEEHHVKNVFDEGQREGNIDFIGTNLDKSGVPLVAAEKFSEPREVEKLVIAPVKKELGLAFKGSQKNVVEALEAMNEKEALEMKTALESKGEVEFYVCTLGKNVPIKKNMVSISKEKKKEHQRVFTPSVIEPSFGIGRIIYCLFEHSFYTRPSKTGDEQLNVFRFPPLVAPIKCTVFPLVQNQQYEDVAKVISKSLTTAGISHKIDITGTSIGKRYARTDELGVPFAITVDSTKDVTIRERDSKLQVRVSVEEAALVVKSVTDGLRTWEDVWEKYPHHTSGSADD
ncbi:hypothetical protein GOBAR_DD14847 [Gossypium barbadense]|nr:hypothetical protein GOBAR_DD14847 [Gossypium barbadense]